MSLCFFFFFKQKTAYEMRISDWSSDVCSSDLAATGAGIGPRRCRLAAGDHRQHEVVLLDQQVEQAGEDMDGDHRRSEERRVGKECVIRVDLGGRRIIKKKKKD